MKKIILGITILLLLVASIVGGMEYLRTVDDTGNRLLCEIREDLGFREGLPTCFSIYG